MVGRIDELTAEPTGVASLCRADPARFAPPARLSASGLCCGRRRFWCRSWNAVSRPYCSRAERNICPRMLDRFVFPAGVITPTTRR